jgi:cell division protein FtsN
MNRAGRQRTREIELELDLPRLVILAVVAVVVVGGAFLLGRGTAPEAPARGTTIAAPSDAEPTYEDIEESEGVFDRVGAGIEREPGRQVTQEPSIGGRFELDLGTLPDRRAAERLRAQASELGVPTLVARDAASGRYRVVAGPFSSRGSATRSAERLRRELGRAIEVRELQP